MAVPGESRMADRLSKIFNQVDLDLEYLAKFVMTIDRFVQMRLWDFFIYWLNNLAEMHGNTDDTDIRRTMIEQAHELRKNL